MVVLNIAAGVFLAAGSDFFMQLIAVDACVCVCAVKNFVGSDTKAGQ